MILITDGHISRVNKVTVHSDVIVDITYNGETHKDVRLNMGVFNDIMDGVPVYGTLEGSTFKKTM